MDYGLDFDDVLVKPVLSSVSSRDFVSTEVDFFGKFKITMPLLAAPMKDIVNVSFLKALSSYGGFGFLHRFYKDKYEWMKDVANLELNSNSFGVSVGLNSPDYEWLLDYKPSIILVDIANGYLKDLQIYCEKVKSRILEKNIPTLLMAGNVVEESGALSLVNSGADIIRVGIGGGSSCSTRNVTGISIPNITAMERCSLVKTRHNVMLVMDGGIRNSGDLVKSIVAGADLGMAGRLYGETYESPAEEAIYGMASRTHHEKNGLRTKSVEGFDIRIKKKHSLVDFINEFTYGIKSAGTYLDAVDLDGIRENGEFIRVSDSSIKKIYT